ncbi:hypothetical protein E2C01_088062 [Portunus trituberculatus]|uniref:Uncharacterized protein n=1 Tax=Portunus trituberculatus TaxID=210409 RepID=A0A5B7JDH5_PORTR|nr:hypothetical protein [Portunus trituberculatus]
MTLFHPTCRARGVSTSYPPIWPTDLHSQPLPLLDLWGTSLITPYFTPPPVFLSPCYSECRLFPYEILKDVDTE